MKVAHGVWTTTAENGPGLALWAEDEALYRQAMKFRPISDFPPGSREPSRNPRTNLPGDHLFALEAGKLKQILWNPAGLAEGRNATKPVASNLALVLPTQEDGPLCSIAFAQGVPDTEMTLSPWNVPVLLLNPAQALTWLLSNSRHLGTRHLILGDSIHFWRDAANLTLYCLIHGTYEPNLQEEDHQVKAGWVLNERILENQLEHLEARMPALCRHVWHRDGTRMMASAVIKSFLNDSIDHMIRHVSGPAILSHLPLARAGRRRKRQNPLDMLTVPLIKSIYTPQNTFSAARDVQVAFVALMSNWLRSAEKEKNPRWQTCFTVLMPEIGQASIQDLSPDLRIWRVVFSLKNPHDPTDEIHAHEIWENLVPTQVGENRTLAEILLEGLGRALKHFDALRVALEYPYPTHVDLTTSEAYRFLAEQSPHLVQAGFAVCGPPWWAQRTRRLKAKLKIDGSSFDGPSMLGFNTVVNYQWRASIGDKFIQEEDFSKLVKDKLPLVPINGEWVEIHPEDLDHTIKFFSEHETRGTMRLMDAMHMGLEADELRSAMDDAKFDYKGHLARLFSEDQEAIPQLPQPERFKGQLRPYQLEGLSWLTFHHHLGFGACLADDMGLGKTVQLLALLLYEREHWKKKTRGKPTLLVCPMSVVGNWHREARRFAPLLKVMIHHGANRYSKDEFLRIHHRYDLIITTYQLINRDRETFEAVRWYRLALDEAQNMKNPNTQQSQAILGQRAEHRVALTGTPVENKLSELWAILEFLNPGYLGPLREFQARFATPIERQNNKERANLLRQLTQPFILRRLKTDKRIIKDLPEKIEMKVYCDLTQEQAAMYQAFVQQQLDAIDKADGIRRNQLVLTTLVKLKQICNHPAHFLKDNSMLDGRSGKLMRLTEMLEEAIDEGDKSLIFTQYTEMGHLLEDFLQKRFDLPVLFLHGGVPRNRREEIISRFNRDDEAKIFVLTVKTGGTGLNLTAARHVFHYDRWWNPAVENQATDRAFRIGQTRNVQVRKMIAIGTLEDRIDMMIERKRDLAENIIGTDEAWLTQMSTEALREVLSLSVDRGDDL